jgi:hypothetical protein
LGETTTREQINKLDSIEFIWNVLDANWEKMFVSCPKVRFDCPFMS